MTQKQFGEKLGFLGKTSDVRITQYESEVRALTVPDIDTQLGLMHTLFAIEDMYGLKIDELDGEISKDQYDDWRYKYPELDTHQFSVDILPKEISDALIKEEKKKSKSNKKK